MKKTAGSPLQSFPSVGIIPTTWGARLCAARATAASNRACWANAVGTYTTPLSRVCAKEGYRFRDCRQRPAWIGRWRASIPVKGSVCQIA